MMWHPLITKWALLIKTKSSKAYQTIKDFINLYQCTLYNNYSHVIGTNLGFQPKAIDKLVDEGTSNGMFDTEWTGYVGIIQDEVKIKDNHVFCQTTGQLLGYVHLDKTGEEMLALENALGNSKQELVKLVLVLRPPKKKKCFTRTTAPNCPFREIFFFFKLCQDLVKSTAFYQNLINFGGIF